MFGSNGGTNYVNDATTEYTYTLFNGSNVSPTVSTGSNSAIFDSYIANIFNYANGSFGNGGANVTNGNKGVVIIKYPGTKRLCTGGTYYLYNGNSFHMFSNVGTEIFYTTKL